MASRWVSMLTTRCTTRLKARLKASNTRCRSRARTRRRPSRRLRRGSATRAAASVITSSAASQRGRFAMKRAVVRRAKLPPKPKAARGERRPLLVIDGDSFTHRSYHALPKTILRDRGRPAGAILGFANRLVQLYRTERPRAVLVAWDTLEAETYRHKAFADYQGGREFDDA